MKLAAARSLGSTLLVSQEKTDIQDLAPSVNFGEAPNTNDSSDSPLYPEALGMHLGADISLDVSVLMSEWLHS